MRGFCGIGIYHPKYECNQGTLWRTAYAFGASFIYTVGPRFVRQASDTTKAWRHVPMYNFDNIEELVKRLPYSCHLIGVELDGTSLPLHNFTHPEQACYLLGAEDHGLPDKVIKMCNMLVQVPDLKTCLNVATTGSLVLYDRKSKTHD